MPSTWRVWLVYDEVRAARNTWMIRRYQELGEELGIEMHVVVVPVRASVAQAREFLAAAPWPVHAAVVRCDAPAVRALCAELGVPVYNPDDVARVGNDKLAAYKHFSARGVPMLPTVAVRAGSGNVPFPYPFVVKPSRGHGGAGVERVQGRAEWENLRLSEGGTIAQLLGDTPGVDVRVYLLGGEIMAAVRRHSEGDFRANFSLGGSAVVHDLGPKERQVVDAVTGALPQLRESFVGVDLLPHGGGWVLNEVEDIVGTRMLYDVTDIDAARLHVQWLRDQLRDRF